MSLGPRTFARWLTGGFQCSKCQRLQFLPTRQLRRLHSQGRNSSSHNAGDDPNFSSVIDQPAVLVRSGQRHGPGLILLALIPLTAFALGTWQVQRLSWKVDLIAKYEDRLLRPPLPLPPKIDPSAVGDFDHRRVTATGRFRHDQEMLVGPRINEEENGYFVITPLEREGEGSTILVNRGWIPKRLKDQRAREAAARASTKSAEEPLPRGVVTVEGLLREPWKKNMFTPDNQPEKGEWYFPDVHEMAKWAGSQPVWIEETMEASFLNSYAREERGIPIGRASEVKLSNNHLQYVVTWYGLSLATSVMLWMVVKKPLAGSAGRVRHSRQW
ncbi:COX1 assembly protein [Eremomyces bilateralis CBS 781.70]|uniref:SURF1-like protein n=1 Tax=Eremomyces bilateralis CBS 781.70 TaxID=1392243 RepID=A0A6G1FVZ5_9PEZI|nr:COX1 assembly protein [Eremomyces bilateralis CBS 781.70]KAF1809876.1 COX1 assembly protein [Eremomyces bilateralis CBS 781.70]